VAPEEQTRRPSSRRAAAEAGTEAERARAAEQVAVAAAELAVEAALDTQAERDAAGLPQRVVLMPSEELRSLVRSMIEGLQGGGPAGPPADGASRVGDTLTVEQQQLTLTYDVFRTALGRRGAASIVLYRIDRDGTDTDRIVIEQGVASGSWIVVYGRRSSQPDDPVVEIGRARYEEREQGAVIPGLGACAHITRVEVLDRHGRPVRLGRPAGPHLTGRPLRGN